ncbi:MAG TPA: sugar ABC transporter permease [Desulfobacteraceae bacterium]|nr:sugar ABC transporter permease [Desulfobacteraceae bacterium]HPJ66963.1 sugar ABC transporter permease [Desulfobacteraceae bacterium]HPQ27699.1 sugar ABC transporter permease [Desulfobacteraceae bacterium]
MRLKAQSFFLILLLPALGILLLFIALPISQSIWLSLHRVIIGLPGLGELFIGLSNYRELFQDPVARHSFWVTLFFVTVTTFFELLIGLFLALLINLRFPGRGALRACVLIPWAIPTVVAAQMWRFLFNDSYGLINYMLFGGNSTSYIPWLALPNTALAAIITADIWKTSSFAALLILAGLQIIPEELNQAAAVDGAGTWRRFKHITLPLIRPALLVALLFRTIDAFRVFDLAFVMTQGGPADGTNVLQLYGYRKLFVEGLMGYGSAISVVIFIIILFLAVLYVHLAGRRLMEARI